MQETVTTTPAPETEWETPCLRCLGDGCCCPRWAVIA